MNIPEEIKVLVITLSDRASRGDYEDLSGPRIHDLVQKFLEAQRIKCSIKNVLIPDDKEKLKEIINVSQSGFDIIFTTGGTGIGPRDITVDVIKPLLTKEIPGIMEFIRVRYGLEKPAALLSRGIAGLLGNTLIYTLPGSARAVNEYMEEILKTLMHTFEMLWSVDSHQSN